MFEFLFIDLFKENFSFEKGVGIFLEAKFIMHKLWDCRSDSICNS